MNGILVIDKPSNMTSRDVVNILNKELKIKKIGHTGTLDPLATGVLVVALGQATKTIELLTGVEKEYVATVQMGVETDTLDITGKELRQEQVPSLSCQQIEEVLLQFIGTYEQEVPLYSAVHVNGQRLYQYAKEGKEVVLPKRTVTIHNIKLLQKDHDTFSFSCKVSKGTYIRSLIRDIGKQLHVPCCMRSLVRTKQGNFTLEESCTIEDIKANRYRLRTIEEALIDYPKVIVSKENVKKVQNGVILPKQFTGTMALLCDSDGHLLAIYQENSQDPSTMRPWKVFSTI